jgi:hypothetical protein
MANRRPSPELRVVNRDREVRWYDSRTGTTGGVTPELATVYERTYTGQQTPDFKTVKKRALPFNNYSLRKTVKSGGMSVFNASQSFVVHSTPKVFVQITGHRHVWAPVDLGSIYRDHLGDANDVAARRFAAQFNHQKASLPLMFHERKKTADMVANTGKRLAYAALALKRGQVRNALNALSASYTKSTERRIDRLIWGPIAKRGNTPQQTVVHERFANAWMEIQFGWRPMLEDIHGSLEILATKFRRESGYQYPVRASGSASFNERVRWFPPYYDWLGLPSSIHGVNAGFNAYKTTTKYYAWYSVDDDTSEALRETGITNPASVVWDAVPFSFVVDWFLPVNNYLKNLGAYSGFTIVDVCRARFTRWSVQVNSTVGATGTEYNGPWMGSATVAYAEDGIVYDRDRTSVPHAPLTFRDPVSTFSAVSSIAILTQLLSGKGR